MSAGLLFETLLLALVFFASLLVVWRAVHPGSLRRARTDLALALLAPARPAWIKRIGRWIAPRPRAGISGPGAGCGGCGGGETKGGCS